MKQLKLLSMSILIASALLLSAGMGESASSNPRPNHGEKSAAEQHGDAQEQERELQVLVSSLRVERAALDKAISAATKQADAYKELFTRLLSLFSSVCSL
jgi:hypothetical protein